MSLVEQKDELVQYIVVNKEIPMSPGKLLAQSLHGLTIYFAEKLLINPSKEAIDRFYAWYDGGKGQKKIVLVAKEQQLQKLVELGWFPVRDNGLTEVPANSLTIVASFPMWRSEGRVHVKRLQTLKDKVMEVD